MGRRINYQRSASTRTSPNRSTTSQSSEDMEVVEDGILQRCVVGPFRFLLFIFSLALSVRRDERLIAHERSKRKTAKKNTLVIQSRTLGGQSKPTEDSGAGSDSDYLRLHHYQKRIGSAEVSGRHRVHDMSILRGLDKGRLCGRRVLYRSVWKSSRCGNPCLCMFVAQALAAAGHGRLSTSQQGSIEVEIVSHGMISC